MRNDNLVTQTLPMNNSWYCTKPLKECVNLFHKDSNNYQSHFYACACGTQDVIVSSGECIPSYSCTECDNQYFINAYHAMNESNIYLYYEDISYTYECESTQKGFKAIAYLYVPTKTNFMQKTMHFEKKKIETFEIIVDHGCVIEVSSPCATELSIALKKYLYSYICEAYDDHRNIILYFNHEQDTNKKVRIILFFLGLPKYLEYVFYFWKAKFNLRGVVSDTHLVTIDMMLNYLLNHRKEHSIKRALLARYRENFWSNMGDQSFYSPKSIFSFDPLVPFVVSRCFDDPNIASMLISKGLILIGYDNEETEREGYRLDTIVWFIMFLKKFYSEKQISKFLLGVHDELDMWSDILALIPGQKRVIKKYFVKVTLTIKSLHDEIVNTTLQEYKKYYHHEFKYEQPCLNACTSFGGMEFRLPTNGDALAQWAHTLHNCLKGYIDVVYFGYVAIYGVFKDNTLMYAVEISDGKIGQMSGKYDVPIASKDAEVIEQWHQNLFRKKVIV